MQENVIHTESLNFLKSYYCIQKYTLAVYTLIILNVLINFQRVSVHTDHHQTEVLCAHKW